MKSRLSSIGFLEGAAALVFLVLIALWAGQTATKPKVTISGLTLEQSLDEVQQILGPPSFRRGTPNPHHVEYWHLSNSPEVLTIALDDSGRIKGLAGGVPEIDGRPVSELGPEQALYLLGTPSSGTWNRERIGKASELVQREQTLIYKHLNLLVKVETNGTLAFHLFRPQR